jgi:hypothetical protein
MLSLNKSMPPPAGGEADSSPRSLYKVYTSQPASRASRNDNRPACRPTSAAKRVSGQPRCQWLWRPRALPKAALARDRAMLAASNQLPGGIDNTGNDENQRSHHVAPKRCGRSQSPKRRPEERPPRSRKRRNGGKRDPTHAMTTATTEMITATMGATNQPTFPTMQSQ